MSEFTEAPLVLTFKAGKNFDDSWLVVRANTPTEALKYLSAISSASQQAGSDLLLAINLTAQEFQGKKGVAQLTQAPAQVAVQSAPPVPQVQQAPPAAVSAVQDPWANNVPLPPEPPLEDDPWGQQSQQAPAQQAPQQQFVGAAQPSNAPTCLHGRPRELKTGISKKSGKPYSMWVCTERSTKLPDGSWDDSGRCEPIFNR